MNNNSSRVDEELEIKETFTFNEFENLQLINKKKLITCTKMNKYFLFPFLTAFFIIIRDIMRNNIIYNNDDINFYLFNMINMDFFMFLGGLIYFIINFKEYKEKELTRIIIKKSEKKINAVNKRGNKEINKIKLFSFYLFMSIFFTFYIFTLAYLSKHIVLEKKQWSLFIIVLLNKFLLKKNILRHQLFSLAFFPFGFIILVIINNRRVESKTQLVSVLSSISYTIYLSFLEYLNKKYDIIIYYTDFVTSIFSLFISFLSFIIYSKIEYGDLSYFKEALSFHGIETKFYIMYIFFVISGIKSELFIIYTIYYFSVTHFIISSFIAPIAVFIESNINRKKEEDYVIIISIIVFIIDIFAVLVYNENIVLNICGLSKYTVKGIRDRAEDEHSQTEKIEKIIREENIEKQRIDIGSYYVDIGVNEDTDEDGKDENEGINYEMKITNN